MDCSLKEVGGYVPSSLGIDSLVVGDVSLTSRPALYSEIILRYLPISALAVVPRRPAYISNPLRLIHLTEPKGENTHV
jgi:hypothetical protein